MNEALKKLTEEIKAKIAEALASDEVKSLISVTKDATDTGSFEVIISTANFDRQGESVKQDGWDLSNFKANPVVLWAHDYSSLPIGVCTEIYLQNGNLTAKGQFAPEAANPFAQQIRRLYDMKIVRATSVGFIAKEMEGNVITKSELLEFSFVPVPANPYALSLEMSKNLDLAMLSVKGMKIEVKAIGDTCTMPDGTEGTIQDDGNGGLTCAAAQKTVDADAGTQADEGKPADDEAQSEEKGAIADELSVEQMYEAKWNKLDPLLDILDAFMCVYLDEATAVDQFDALVAEVITLLQNPPADTAEAKTAIEKARKNGAAFNNAIIFSSIARGMKSVIGGKQKDAQQIGAILAQLQNVIDNALVNASVLVMDIVNTEYGQSVAGKAEIAASLKQFNAIKTSIADVEHKLGVGKGEEKADGLSPKERSVDEGFMESMKSIDDFIMVRNILKSFSTATSSALERLNERARTARKGRK